MRVSALASGSRGNACLVRSGSHGLLIDLGIGPRGLTRRLAEADAEWSDIGAVLLTHTHGDHVREASLRCLIKHRITLYCHEGHRPTLRRSPAFAELELAGLVRHYDDRPWIGPCGMRIEAFEVSHDDDATHGFRIEVRERRWHPTQSLGYLADSGVWTADHVAALCDVDILAVEFNHDVEMQRNSGRPYHLIKRILGDRGHLSNDQGAALVSHVIGASKPHSVKCVVLLHLSEQCNCPTLATTVAREATRNVGWRIPVLVARQDCATPTVRVDFQGRPRCVIEENREIVAASALGRDRWPTSS